MALVTVLSAEVRPERRRIYEALIAQIAEGAREKEPDLEWVGHQVTAGNVNSFAFVSAAEDWSELEARGDIEERIFDALGEDLATEVLDEVAECTTSERYSVARARPDLSCLPNTAEAEQPIHSITMFHARAGEQDGLEELIRKVSQAIPATGDSRRFTTYQVVVGDLRSYFTVMPLASLEDLDARAPADLLQAAFGAEGVLIHRNGLNAVDRIAREMTRVRPEMSTALWTRKLPVRARAASAGAAAID